MIILVDILAIAIVSYLWTLQMKHDIKLGRI